MAEDTPAEDTAGNEQLDDVPVYDEKEPPAASSACDDSKAQPAQPRKGRQELLDQLQAVLDSLTDLDQLQEAVKAVEKLQSDRAGRQPALIRQLAFYFSDANLRRDWFLRKEIAASEGGYVKIAVILPFKRLHVMGCSTAAEIVAAVEAADEKFKLEVSDARDAVRRTGGAPLPPPSYGGPGSEFEKRTVRLSGFPRGDETVGIESVTNLCSPFGAVFFVRLLRDKVTGELFGTVEVEFETEEAAVTFVAMEHQLSWNGKALQACRLCDRAERDWEERKQREAEGAEQARVARKRRLEEEAEAAFQAEKRGLVVRFDDVPRSMSWRALKDGLSPYGAVRFVRFFPTEDGNCHAMVHMKDEDGIFAILGCAKEDEGCLCVQSWPSGRAPEGRKRKRAKAVLAAALSVADDEGQPPKRARVADDEGQPPKRAQVGKAAADAAKEEGDEDKPLAEVLEDAAARPEAENTAEKSEEDAPLNEVVGKVEETEEPMEDEDEVAEEPAEPGPEDDDSSVEQSVTLRLPVTHIGGAEEEEFLRKAVLSQMESQDKGKGKGHGKVKGGKDGKGKSKDGKGKPSKGGKGGKGKGSRKGGKK